MSLLLLLGIFTHIMIGVLYQKLIKETEKMQLSHHKYLEQCKVKFSNYYRTNNGTVNVPVFVDRYMSGRGSRGFPISILSHLSGQAVLLTIFLGGLGACRGIIEGASIGELLPYYMISLLGLYVYFSITTVIDIPKREFIVKTNMVQYLENDMICELKNTDLKQEREKAREKELQLELHENLNKTKKVLFTKSEEQELEELLKEFLA
ncbi:MAG: hypothetical protein PHE02_09475 [Lachnospiraceae bacterium]|nr:hypothetical protein [Lachnospiraceae bacterium]